METRSDCRHCEYIIIPEVHTNLIPSVIYGTPLGASGLPVAQYAGLDITVAPDDGEK